LIEEENRASSRSKINTSNSKDQFEYNMNKVMGKPVKVFRKEADKIKRETVEKDSLNIFEDIYTKPMKNSTMNMLSNTNKRS
jgi:hypothetical protein